MDRALVLLLTGVALAGLIVPGCVTKSEDRPPTAAFTASAGAVNLGQKIIFDAGNSTDKDGKIVRYHWDFGDSSEDLGVSVEHVFSSGGNFTVTLTVTDNDGKKDRTNETVFVNVPPKARIGSTETECKVLATESFSGASSTDPDGRVVGYWWDFGDQTNASGMTVTHAFQDVGTFVVNLTVTDDFGAQDRCSQAVTIVMRDFEASWNVVPHSVPQMSQYQQEHTTVNRTFELEFDNMTEVQIRLIWVDDIPHWLLGKYNDDFAICVTDPANNTQYIRDMGGNITINFSLAELPASLSFKARTADEVEAQIGDRYIARVGRGNWTASIIMEEAGGAQDATNNDLDIGNSWKLDITYFVYELVITEK